MCGLHVHRDGDACVWGVIRGYIVGEVVQVCELSGPGEPAR